jgi:hypothetical protein
MICLLTFEDEDNADAKNDNAGNVEQGEIESYRNHLSRQTFVSSTPVSTQAA